MVIRFHLDEHIDHGIAVGLRGHGIDVTTAADAGLLHADDAAHLAFGLAEGRVVVTFDEDFAILHWQQVMHAGIAYCHQEKYTLGEHLRMLLLLHACFTVEDMSGRLEYL